MATIKYFSDMNGHTEQVPAVFQMKASQFAEMFPGVKGIKSGSSILAAYGLVGIVPVTRKIEYKNNPSKHICNAKCLGGKCTGACECSCGGVNHGRNSFLN